MARGGTTPAWVVGTSSNQTFNLNRVSCIVAIIQYSSLRIAPMGSSASAEASYEVATGLTTAEADAQVAAMVGAVGFPWVIVGAAADVSTTWATLAVNLDRIVQVRDGSGGLIFSDDLTGTADLPVTAGYGPYDDGADAIAGLEAYAGLAYTFSNG